MNTPIIASSVRMNEIANIQFSTVPLRHRLAYTCSDSLTGGKELKLRETTAFDRDIGIASSKAPITIPDFLGARDEETGRAVDSPIIDDIPGGPERLFREYRPTTWPGARLPHVWLADGSAMQDRIREEGFTLLRVGRTKSDTSALGAALQDLGASFATVE